MSGEGNLEDAGLFSQNPTSHLGIGNGFYKDRVGRAEQRSGEETVDVLVVSLAVLMWIFSVRPWNLVLPSQRLQLRDLRHQQPRSGPFLLEAGTGTAGACNMLTKKLLVREFLCLLVHLTLILFHGKSELYMVFIPCYTTKLRILLRRKMLLQLFPKRNTINGGITHWSGKLYQRSYQVTPSNILHMS